ncbi:unnamed protein product [Linum tenue]|uniref:Uncharacterized protein n=1 Tax=Linum tenue TaxID=586396 RepID=A0AAV0JY94_9ROSI|nr:unnamed protein product [Linum tenue]
MRIMAAPPASFTIWPFAILPTMPLSQRTTFPFTSRPLSAPSPHKDEFERRPAPANTSGSCFSGCLLFFCREMDWPSYTAPFPSFAVATSILSKLVAPTVRIHGASFDNVLLVGPKLPAEQLTNIPFSMAANEPTAIMSSKSGVPGSSPMDMDITSTPS